MGCYNDDILFIHIPKCAGWSCKLYLKEHLPGMLMPDNPAAKLPIGHIRLQDIERFTGRAPASFKKILAVIRNPYEQQLSQWIFWRDRYAKGGRHVHDTTAATYPTLEQWLEDPRCDFHVWYEQHVGYGPGMTQDEQREAAGGSDHRSQRPEGYTERGGLFRYWITVDGEIPENVEIHEQESLAITLPSLVANVTGTVVPPMGRHNSTPHGNARDYYTPKAAKLVENKFEWAFENHYQRWLYSDFA